MFIIELLSPLGVNILSVSKEIGENDEKKTVNIAAITETKEECEEYVKNNAEIFKERGFVGYHIKEFANI